jgi:hypothetical protein
VEIHCRYCMWEAMHTESENGIQDALCATMCLTSLYRQRCLDRNNAQDRLPFSRRNSLDMLCFI